MKRHEELSGSVLRANRSEVDPPIVRELYMMNRKKKNKKAKIWGREGGETFNCKIKG
jgi:hypothetical protein